MAENTTAVRGPYFDELTPGLVLTQPPAVTLTSGLQAAHAAVVGNRLSLALDHELAHRVAGGPLAGPALVWDVSIGQSTVATQHVKANLFYRGLWFHRQPLLGDTLRTTTTVVGLRENTRRVGRPSTGLAELRITTVDHEDRLVLDYRRCAMILLSPDAGPTGYADELSTGSGAWAPSDSLLSMTAWDLGAVPRPSGAAWEVGGTYDVVGGDVVSSAPELARLTGNGALVHHDRRVGGGDRLVYGGHSIGLAFHHVCQVFPGLVTVAGWKACDHLSPVREGDYLTSSVSIEGAQQVGDGLAALDLHVTTSVAETPVLSWRPVVLVASG
ncbi:MaoC family dehydratase [Pedococcus sp. 5OH_020]|uniref:MaoC family dehydratase n=1 Tax=Pedococcus sp. 5OH_020 TaxID=2989814 RepID=UPI0022E9B8AA|nr:MaoC family dehydratase [Pedococcus sp. 5OH_020]